MSILSRLTALLKANMNQLIDQSKNPEEKINKTLRAITMDLGVLQAEITALEEEEINARERLEQLGASDDETVLESETLETIRHYNNLTLEVKRLQVLEEKLVIDLTQLEKRRNEITNNLISTDEENEIDDMLSSVVDPEFGSYEEEIIFKLKEANALHEFHSKVKTSKEALSIDEEIAAIQAEHLDK